MGIRALTVFIDASDPDEPEREVCVAVQASRRLTGRARARAEGAPGGAERQIVHRIIFTWGTMSPHASLRAS